MGRPLIGHKEYLGNGTIKCRLRNVPLGYAKTEEEADRLIEAAKQYELAHRHPKSVRVQGEAYLKEREQDEQSRRGVKGAYTEARQTQPMWDRYIATSVIIDMHVEDVRLEHIKQLVKDVYGRPCERYNRKAKTYVETGARIGQRTVKRLLSLLRQFFEWAPKLSKFGNPVPHGWKFKDNQPQKARLDTDRIPHLHLDEIERIFALPIETLTPYHRAAIAIGIYAGCRKGEIAALRWENVHFGGKDHPAEVWIRASWLSFPKNAGSQREIPMLPQLRRELLAYRKWLLETGQATVEQVQGDHLLFPSPETGEVRCKYWDAGWKDLHELQNRRALPGIRTQAKVRRHIHFKHFRHTFGTHMMRGSWSNGEGVDLIALSTMMGHKDLKMLMHHYGSRDVELAHIAIRKVGLINEGEAAE